MTSDHPKTSHRRRIVKFVGWTAAAAVAAAGFFAFRSYRERAAAAAEAKAAAESARPPRKIAVTVAPVTARAIQRRISAVGTLHGFEEIEVAAKVGGRVARISADIGDVVRPGDELLAIDDTDYKLAVAEAERALEMELARFALTEPPDEQFDIRKTPTVARAMLLEANAKKRLARAEALAQESGRGAIGEQELEQAQTDFQVAEANTRQAKFDAAQTLAAIRWRQSALAMTRQTLADARIVAPEIPIAEAPKRQGDVALTSHSSESPPLEYAVAERRVSVGEMLSTMPPTALFRLVVDRPLKLKAAIPERHIGEIRVGQKAELFVEAYPGEAIPAHVARINPTVNEENRTFEIEVHTSNADRRLRPGAFAKVEILTKEDSDAPTVPEEAVVQFAGVVKVFVVKDGKAVAAPIKLGARKEVREADKKAIWIEAEGNLEAGMQVVTSGHSQLAEGTPVRIRKPLATSAE
jgi:multidrug efflux pump subunit AcrA (membrane-fusion protein)